ncbi:hypothetical protein [Nitratireductor sp. XY-223]|uniref:hypothetical protein n=1 Tax=Nitratireductor sp. XY-223 TaxID=2561926 RepID=UPI0010AA60EB|nr:hypothetical protein [Nitratireductor sp. XY-223]
MMRNTGKLLLVGTVLAAALQAVLLSADSAISQTGNPLLTAPMPVCGVADGSFEGLFRKLGHQSAWRGRHENGEGELELTTGRDGAWVLFYHTKDRQDRSLVCVIARGNHARARFGRPV